MLIKKFTVKGRGEFPLDMLRYDNCWPATGEDVAKVRPLYENAETSEEMSWREVRLCTAVPRKTAIGITPERWRSYGWEVIAEAVG